MSRRTMTPLVAPLSEAGWRIPDTWPRLALVALAALLNLTISCERAEPPSAEPPLAPRPHAISAGPRVVVLSPAVARSMRDLGLAGAIVGRHASDAWCDQSLPICGDQSGVDYEAVLRARPTHVLLQRSEVPARLAELAARHGWAVHNFSVLSLGDIRDATERIWRVCGPAAEPGSADISPWDAIGGAMERAWSPREGIDSAAVGRVLLLAGIDPPAALGPGSCHAELLAALGCRSALDDWGGAGAYVTLDAEDVLRLAPDSIVLFAPRLPRDDRPSAASALDGRPDTRALFGRIATLNIPAVRGGRLAVIDDPEGLLPSTAMIGVAEDLARILEDWSTGPPR